MLTGRQKYIQFFCLVYIAGHLCIAFLSVRKWPFTDYPMFSIPIYKNDKIFVYRYSLIKTDGTRSLLGRAFAQGYGVGELNISKLLREGKLQDFKKKLAQWFLVQPNQTEIKSILITKINAIPPDRENEYELIIEEKIVLEIPKEELDAFKNSF